MSNAFALRFVLASGHPTFEEVAPLWEGSDLTPRRTDGVLELFRGEVLLAAVDLLTADEARARTVVSGVRRKAEALARGEALDAITFVLDHMSGVIVASPVAADEAELEEALSALDVLWEYLFEAHDGLLQVDGEGIYGEEGPLVEEA